MKKQLINTIWLGILTTVFLLQTTSYQYAVEAFPNKPTVRNLNDELKKVAFKILDSKCNVCHRKQNPFMIFSMKNMEKRAKKINKQVFIQGRMPKGDEIKLTDEEYASLKKWLHSLNIK